MTQGKFLGDFGGAHFVPNRMISGPGRNFVQLMIAFRWILMKSYRHSFGNAKMVIMETFSAAPSLGPAVARIGAFVHFDQLHQTGPAAKLKPVSVEPQAGAKINTAQEIRDLPPTRETRPPYDRAPVLAFDPHSTEEIASSLLRISRGAELREQLRARGKERAQMFTWERTAKTYRALYRKVAGFPLSEEDHNLLSSVYLC